MRRIPLLGGSEDLCSWVKKHTFLIYKLKKLILKKYRKKENKSYINLYINIAQKIINIFY